MTRRQIIMPVKEEEKEFCEYMGYTFKGIIEGWSHFEIPPGHICRFRINFQRWKNGEFDREKFLAKTEV